MRRIWTLIFLTTLLLTVSANAQPNRIKTLADKLSRQTEDLAERAYTDYKKRENNNRMDLDGMMLAQQLVGLSNAFRRMVQDERSRAELRDAINLMSETSRRFPFAGSSSYLWRDASRTIDDLLRGLDETTENEN